MKTVNSKEFEDTSEIPPRVLQKFRELGVFGARIHEDYHGMNLLTSEFVRLLETVGTIPSLGLLLLKQGVAPIDILNKYGTVEQKLKYLPKIAAGQSLATVAITETYSGPAIKEFSTLAVASNCGNYWILDGEKKFVSNANIADMFIVFGHAMQGGDVQKRQETISSFIVDIDTEGVTVVRDSPQMTGLKSFNAGRIIFKDVKIPRENLIGEIGNGRQQLVELFTNGRHYIAGLTIPLLKNYLHLLSSDVFHRKHFEKNLYQTAACQNIIAKLTASIYSMESTLYLTTSMIDIYDGQDVQLEAALLEQYCVDECMQRLQESLWLVGSRACTLVHPFEQVLRDAFTLTNFETSLIDTQIYSGLLGLQHYGQYRADHIRKTRNPFMFPYYVLSLMADRKSRHLNLHLEEYLHPSLKECARFCDNSLYRLQDSAEKMLLRDGIQVLDNQGDLQRIGKIAMLIYVYVASIGRASRSYCIGNNNADYEIKLCFLLCYKLHQQVSLLADEIHVSEYTNGDYVSREIGERNFEVQDYIAAHPLQRNY